MPAFLLEIGSPKVERDREFATLACKVLIQLLTYPVCRFRGLLPLDRMSTDLLRQIATERENRQFPA